ncbi:hypothetical protein [Aureimonas sp. ME7]|uniref:hypothetical protein n=1 Tax=Aureimonas sp. ME7 TaxID=2744252 RepID=UPI0015F5A0DD|nr:hypothetical protein [Aureimonas sp. ME7]
MPAMAIPVGFAILRGGMAAWRLYRAYRTVQMAAELADQISKAEAASEELDASPERGKPCDGCAPGYVGTQDKDSRDQGNRHNSGPLAPENGGTGDAEKDFDHLTGGQSQPAGDRFPEGSRVGPGGELFRPGSGSKGPRIDIPASGGKRHETLHY